MNFKLKLIIWLLIISALIFACWQVLLINDLFDAIEEFEDSLEMESFNLEIEPPKVQEVEETSEEFYRYITAYSAEVAQTDSTPCIAASGINVCESDLPIIATNELPFWTKVEIGGKMYVVLDRMSNKYPHRYDILFGTKKEAIDFGIQLLPVRVIKNEQ